MTDERNVAERLGLYLRPLIAAVDADFESRSGSRTGEVAAVIRRLIFADVFGQKLETTLRAPLFLLGDVFEVPLGVSHQPLVDRALMRNGEPALVIWDLSASAFFRQPTLVDVRTGAIYQGVHPSTKHEFYGPKLPPPEARLIGTFKRAQLRELARIIRDSARRP